MAEEMSPLQEIERRVQLRAKEISLDMAGDDGRSKLRSLIAEEVGAWSDGYKRGLRAFDLSDPHPSCTQWSLRGSRGGSGLTLRRYGDVIGPNRGRYPALPSSRA